MIFIKKILKGSILHTRSRKIHTWNNIGVKRKKKVLEVPNMARDLGPSSPHWCFYCNKIFHFLTKILGFFSNENSTSFSNFWRCSNTPNENFTNIIMYYPLP